MERPRSHRLPVGGPGVRPVALVAACALALAALSPAPGARAQVAASERLNEVPMYEVPEGVSWEQYRDANLRLGTAFLRAPLPGGVHFYAGERKAGWALAGTIGGGVVLSIVGAALIAGGDEKPGDTDYETVDIGGLTYERIPVRQETDAAGNVTTDVRLRRLKDEPDVSAAGPVLLGLGIAAIATGYLVDILHGAKVVEDKRDRARYEIGRRRWSTGAAEDGARLDLKVTPVIDPERRMGAVQVGASF